MVLCPAQSFCNFIVCLICFVARLFNTPAYTGRGWGYYLTGFLDLRIRKKKDLLSGAETSSSCPFIRVTILMCQLATVLFTESFDIAIGTAF